MKMQEKAFCTKWRVCPRPRRDGRARKYYKLSHLGHLGASSEDAMSPALAMTPQLQAFVALSISGTILRGQPLFGLQAEHRKGEKIRTRGEKNSTKNRNGTTTAYKDGQVSRHEHQMDQTRPDTPPHAQIWFEEFCQRNNLEHRKVRERQRERLVITNRAGE